MYFYNDIKYVYKCFNKINLLFNIKFCKNTSNVKKIK